MAAWIPGDWRRCEANEVPACKGIVPTGGLCLAHASAEDRDSALRLLSEAGEIDVRGVEISAELLNRILDAAPRTETRELKFKIALFSGATFAGDAKFDGAT